MRVLFVAQDSKLFHMRRLADAIGKYRPETEVVRYNQYAYPSPRFPLLPSRRLLARIVGWRPDVVFTDIYHWDAWVSKLGGIPVLAHMRGDFWTEASYLYRSRVRTRSLPAKLTATWTRVVTETGINYAHTVLPICNWLAEIVRRHRRGKRIRVLYQPIEPEIWSADLVESRIRLDHPAAVIVFDFNTLPKVLGLIRFLPVARVMPNVNFYVAGSGPYLNYVISQNLPANVKMLGRLSYPDGVRAFIDEGDVFVHPSGQDACPLSVMEAQLMKKPVIASSVGGIPEVVWDRQLLVKDGNTQDWIRKIQNLLDHPARREIIGCRGRHFIEEKFSLDRISRDLFEYMRKVASE